MLFAQSPFPFHLKEAFSATQVNLRGKERKRNIFLSISTTLPGFKVRVKHKIDKKSVNPDTNWIKILNWVITHPRFKPQNSHFRLDPRNLAPKI
ncbi:hypothetical protein J0895_25505 [Phormidium pseudopriestleyi FRX01]|uniref:Uncharacterized protein n=1 Tax=Phormidium pseudopriestleyi FRX01 TaxID=1759528 RepID=A0ABS3FZ13_9CYAN|nr:hypothetical protein [Phormidium pseudopriestleyi]MBO0352375.1 hypothetical protein [Phormidium pseudopriestleyi FRX01]